MCPFNEEAHVVYLDIQKKTPINCEQSQSDSAVELINNIKKKKQISKGEKEKIKKIQ
jgi:hypothetical protein